MLEKTPEGLDEIIRVFGSIDDPGFEQKNIVLFDLPYPLLFGEQAVTRARCHRLVVENFKASLGEIKDAGLSCDVEHYGGIYQRRAIRGYASHPSTHSWGIAVDLEPALYPLGSLKRFPEQIVDIFRKNGFFYGGDFQARKDPMHFQFARGY